MALENKVSFFIDDGASRAAGWALSAADNVSHVTLSESNLKDKKKSQQLLRFEKV